MKVLEYPTLLCPNNYCHKAGGGTSTRKKTVKHIIPVLQANEGGTQRSYLMEEIYDKALNCTPKDGTIKGGDDMSGTKRIRIRKLTPKECWRSPDGIPGRTV